MDAAAPARDGMAGREIPVSHHDPRDRHGAVTAFLSASGASTRERPNVPGGASADGKSVWSWRPESVRQALR
jgi:hypothetical protein